MSGGGNGRDNAGATGSSTSVAEIELKLRIPPARLRDVLKLPLLSSQKITTRKLVATYFDTPALDLSRRHIALRVRREGRRWVQAIKGAGTTLSGVHERLEIENVLKDSQPDLSVLPRSPFTKILRTRKVTTALVPVLQTDIRRSLRLLEPAPGVLIEVAIDQGVIRSGRRRSAVCEIELELKSGPVTALFNFAQQIMQAVPLAPEYRSKAERGYALFRGQTAPPVKAAPVLLSRGMTANQVFCAIAAAALAQVQANEYGVLAEKDPEYLHQMRVGMRRLRSAFSLFRDWLGDTAVLQLEALRTMGSSLGPARDWDVLMTETLPLMRPALTAHGAAEPFEALCQSHHRAARKKLKLSIKSNSYNNSMLMLGAWLAERGSDSSSAAWRQPARVCAMQILKTRYARVLKRGRGLEHHAAAELHRLRIAIKQLRYAVEFFSALFPGRSMTTLRDRLAKLQDILGRINDAAVVGPLVGAAAATTDDREVIVAAGMVIGWCEARAAAERAELRSAWRRIRVARLPWRK